MQAGLFMFIKRKWEEDKLVLNKFIDYFSEIQHKSQVSQEAFHSSGPILCIYTLRHDSIRNLTQFLARLTPRRM